MSHTSTWRCVMARVPMSHVTRIHELCPSTYSWVVCHTCQRGMSSASISRVLTSHVAGHILRYHATDEELARVGKMPSNYPFCSKSQVSCWLAENGGGGGSLLVWCSGVAYSGWSLSFVFVGERSVCRCSGTVKIYRQVARLPAVLCVWLKSVFPHVHTASTCVPKLRGGWLGGGSDSWLRLEAP